MNEWHQIIADDFKAMHAMLNDIEIKISGVQPEKQFEFIKHIKYLLVEAVKDVNDDKDSFLFGK